MPELTFICDPLTGTLLVEETDQVDPAIHDELARCLGPGQTIACAAPATPRPPSVATPGETATGRCVRAAGYWHGSLIEGPGRRSVAKLIGCPLRCHGCVTPDSWDPTGGVLTPVDRLADALLDPADVRDGVTILGGEPTAQPNGLLALVRALRARNCPHLLVYSGYTYESLRRMAEREWAIGAVLDTIDVLIDGPYVASLAQGAGPWTGSGNQRVIDLPATRRAGRVVLWGQSV